MKPVPRIYETRAQEAARKRAGDLWTLVAIIAGALVTILWLL